MVEKLVINGGKPLKGEVTISGAKNAAVAILPATLLADGISVIENLPYIDDVVSLKNTLTFIGAKAEMKDKGTMIVDPRGISTFIADTDMISKMRASYYLLGVLLGKFGKAEVSLPGGCDIGARPIDQHIKGLEAMGASIKIEHGVLKAYSDGQLKGTEIYLDVVSVGATINIMLAAVLAKGQTSIVNAAKEPHVVDVANFLNCMGASVKGAGTDVIRIQGTEELHGCEYSLIPDQIEAGTIMMAAAATKGDVTIRNIIPVHLEAVSAKLIEMGAKITDGADSLRIKCDRKLKSTTIKTFPYPGFPTDLQQPMTALLSTADGTSVVIENIFEERFKHVYELRRMGADITIDNRVAIIEGVDRLTGASVRASDLRAGAALIIAGLMAEGTTKISGVKHIDRGYEKIEEKLISLGADITRIKDEEDTKVDLCDEPKEENETKDTDK